MAKMPNIRQLRQRERKTRQWSPEAMTGAMEEVQAGRLTIRQAAAQFGVPKSSLSDRVSGRVASDCGHGQRPLLSTTDENALVEYCLYSASYGFPLTKPQVLAHALAIYNQRHPEAPRAALGQTWWINFRERHHQRLTTRTPDIIDRGRASCAKRGPIEEYFQLLQATIDEHGLREKPHHIYNCDETGFQLDSVRRKVIVPRGSKHAYRQAPGTRDHITVLACFNAAGEDVPPFIIYKGGYPGGPYNKEGVPNALYGKSQAGYIDGELFRKWFVGHFLKYATKERPLLLVMDGHQSHLGPELVQAAQREGVILLCLPPHTSHILQPLDVSFFGPLKADVSGVTSDLSAVSHSFLVSKKEFSRVLKHSYQRVKNRGVVVAGFRRCGLYPLDPDAIDWSRVMPSGPQRRAPSPPPPAPPSPPPPSSPPPPPAPPSSPPSPPAPPSSPPSPPAPPSSPPSPPAPPSSPPPPPPCSPPPPPTPPCSPPHAPPPPPPDAIYSHPLVTSGRIPADLSHLLVEVKFARANGKARRNITKARVLTAQEMTAAIEEAEDRAARREAQALARRDREQQRAEDICPAATSALPGGSHPSCITVSPGGSTSASSGQSITGPSAPLAPSRPSCRLQLPASCTTPAPVSLPAQRPRTQDEEPSTSGLRRKRKRRASSPLVCRLSSSPLSPSTGPMTSITGHTAKQQRVESRIWRCGRCKQPDPPGEETAVSWVQCDNCSKWFHSLCVSWEGGLEPFFCYWCVDV